MAAGIELARKLFTLTLEQAALGAAMGLIAIVVYFLGIFWSMGGGILLDPTEIPVSLAGALGGPFGGMIAGFLQGVVFAPERNIPSHMAAGLFAGLWYYLAWRTGQKGTRPRLIRTSIWIIGIPIYYYLVLMPVYICIYATELKTSFIQLYLFITPKLVPEVALTIAITGFILAVLPEKYSRPPGFSPEKPGPAQG